MKTLPMTQKKSLIMVYREFIYVFVDIFNYMKYNCTGNTVIKCIVVELDTRYTQRSV